MLVLDRRCGEFIRIHIDPSTEPQELIIRVTHITSARVKLGFEANRSVKVMRAELEEVLEQAPVLAAHAAL